MLLCNRVRDYWEVPPVAFMRCLYQKPAGGSCTADKVARMWSVYNPYPQQALWLAGLAQASDPA